MLVVEVIEKVLKVSDTTLKKWWHKGQMSLLDMQFFPSQKHTFVVPYSKKEVLDRIQEQNKPISERRNKDDFDNYEFNGYIGKNGFSISPLTKYVDNFIPLIQGSIENTSRGSIVSLSYELFFSTKVYLIFSLFLALVFTPVFIFVKPNIFYILLSWSFFVISYWVAKANFERNKKKTHQLLCELFK
jgi:hypothetical protein